MPKAECQTYTKNTLKKNKMPLNKDVGNWIKDFMKSNAPQFKGK